MTLIGSDSIAKHCGKIQSCSPFGTSSSPRGNTSSLPCSILSSGDQIRVRELNQAPSGRIDRHGRTVSGCSWKRD
ncbi:hypothetical protein OPV22_016161 [Ensete ventricosum]|uniref:Uncharacterized protein n=1 Tax=Ensete ventricosum TaxID=4639 RepID=A0AAV8QPQ2_ENSVE|nr:hypothetical protein OPV22_016161 [Ensete ventricosum]